MSRKSKPAEVQSAAKLVTVKLRLPPDVVDVIQVEALGRKVRASDLVAELVRNTPRRFVLSERTPGPKAQGSADVLKLGDPAGTLGQVG